MKLTSLLLFIISVTLLQSCAKKNVFWVSGIKTECVAGTGKTTCLQVFKNDKLENPTWENFYAPIQGFEFEEGYLKKIEVKQEKLNPKNVPADASSIQYTLVKEIEKQKDIRVLTAGDWLLGSIYNHHINRMVRVPSLKVDLTKMMISGHTGCNQYSGSIEKITPIVFNLGNVISTKKACIQKNIEPEFLKGINEINTYHIKGNHLIFYNAKSEKILSFIKNKKVTANQGLHDIWAVTRLNGNPLNKMVSVPRLEINLFNMRIMGNDGCNNFSAKINTATSTKLNFSAIALTRKACLKAGVEDEFNKALNKVKTYKLEGVHLTLKDKDGKEVLSFLKVD